MSCINENTGNHEIFRTGIFCLKQIIIGGKSEEQIDDVALQEIFVNSDYKVLRKSIQDYKQSKMLESNSQLSQDLSRQIFSEKIELPIYVDITRGYQQNSDKFDKYI